MLSNHWNLYRQTFAASERGIIRAALARELPKHIAQAALPMKASGDDNMSPHRSRRPTSSDSGYSTTSEGPTSPSKEPASIPSSAPTQKTSLFSSATRTDLTTSIGTQLSNVQLSSLTSPQLEELALLVSERGVVFFRGQDLTAEDQIRISEQYGDTHGTQIVERTHGSLKVKSSLTDHGEKFTYAVGKQSEWRSDRSFEVHPPTYSIIRVKEVTGIVGDIIWISQYSLYDALSKHMKRLLDDLDAVHTSQLEYESIVNLRGMPWNRAPVQNKHPAVRSHPITGLKALNVAPGAVSRFAELNEKESDKLLELLEAQMHASDEHTVRFKWEVGSVAIWDNRCIAYKSIPGSPTSKLSSTETTSIGEIPYFDAQSESRNDKVLRLAREEEEELERVEETKARYNNTPLRRILRRQAHGEITFTDELQSPKEETSQAPITPKKGRTEMQDSAIIIEQKETPKTSDSTRVGVSSKGSPLRRIIQRQASSGSVGARRRDWK